MIRHVLSAALLASNAGAQALPAFELTANPPRPAAVAAPEPKLVVTRPVPVFDRSKLPSKALKLAAEQRAALLKDVDDARVVRFVIPKTKEYVARIVERLLAGSGLKAQAPEVRVNDSSWGSPSASLSAGVLFIDPELIAVMSSEDEVAAVIAHELIHHLRAHHEQLAETLRRHPRGGGGDLFTPSRPSKAELDARWGHECEADALSLRLLANAGYDPAAAADALIAVKREIDGEPRHEFSRGRSDGSHPPLEVRVDYLKRVMAAERMTASPRSSAGLPEVYAELAGRRRSPKPEDAPASELYRHYRRPKSFAP
ncbi:MAG: M48 family metalloprotease [Elusimicrobia bacterium]|nr:M48 family metalloprotease [Elusimicrobiota bacterium]